jgi:hypothetical protein
MTRSQWIIRLLETVLANPPANRPVSLKAPSDPEFAFRAIFVAVAGLSLTEIQGR